MLDEYVLLVLHKLGGSLAAFSLADGSTLYDMKTADFPHEMCLSPDRRRIYLTEYGLRGVEAHGTGGQNVAIVDVATGNLVAKLDTSPYTRPHGIVSHSNGQLWVTVEANGRVLSYDIQSGKMRLDVETGGKIPHIVTMSPDGQTAVVANIGTGDVVFINAQSGIIEKRVAVGVRPEGMVFTQNGGQLFVVNRESNDISVIEVATAKVINTIPTGRGGVRLVATPDGKKLVTPLFFADAAQVIDVEAQKVIATIKVGKQPAGTAISPDGRFAFFSCEMEARVYVVSLDTYEVVKTVDTGDGPDAMQCLTRMEFAALQPAA